MSDDSKKRTNDTEVAPPSTPLLPVIRAGEAQLAVTQALDALTGAYLRLEGVSMAIARALDERA